jgi:hypothetical protein
MMVLQDTNVSNLSIYLHIYPPIYPYTYGSIALVDLGRFFSFLIHTQSVGLIGLGFSPSQDHYLDTEQHTYRLNAHR